MPPPALIDPELWNVGVPFTDEQGLHDLAGVQSMTPQRFEMAQLDGVSYFEPEHVRIVGWRDAREDDFWVRGHIPGRPLMPGVVMLEALAQLTSVAARKVLGDTGFFGFGGVDSVKFRATVTPGQRLVLLAEKVDIRPRRAIWSTQGWVDGKMAVQAKITGIRM